MDTIFALASARGKAGVSVIRVSGHKLREALSGFICPWPEPRRAVVRTLRVGSDVLDQALVIWFPAGSSFTGEEIVEFQVHGSVAIVSRLLDWLRAIDGFRLAEAGEFTRRALLNGRIDLTQVEGLADLIEAETEAQRRQAMRVFSGELAARCEEWKEHLLKASAYLAATIDFADEDLPDALIDRADDHVSSVLEDLRAEATGFHVSERIRDGFEVAILGRPNVGKSTLLNRIARREAALTSSIAGTTRDVIEVRVDLGGLPVTFLDTAGLRETSDPLESMGMERAIERAKAADLRVVLVEHSLNEVSLEPVEDDLVVFSKDDAGEREDGVSGSTGAGVPQLLRAVEKRLLSKSATAALITRSRHREAVESAIASLERFRECKETSGLGVEVLSMYVDEAKSFLGILMGRFDVEDVLGEIFSSFCIGK